MAWNLKALIKDRIERSGWFVRKTRGLTLGSSLRRDFEVLGLANPDVIFDIGAHVGESSLQYAGYFPTSRIFAFEPVADNYKQLKLNTKGIKNIRCINKAVGGEVGLSQIALDGTNTQAHSLAKTGGDRHRTETVRVTTVDSFALAENARPNFIKIDVEGFELEVLRGAEQTLRSGSIETLLLEATFSPYDGGSHTQLSDLCDHLKPRSFRPVAIYDQCAFGSPLMLMYFNILFVRH